MPIAPVYLNGMISATPEISALKVSDDNKAALIQSNTENTIEREAEDHANQVVSKDDVNNDQAGYNASEEGSNKYAGDGGRNRQKKKEFGKVVTKKQGGFNITV